MSGLDLGLRADGSLSSTGVLLAATPETVRTRLEETGARSADSRVGLTGLDVRGRTDGSLAGAGISLAATSEAVGARLEETSAGSANGGIRLSDLELHSLDGLVGARLIIGAPCDAASLGLAAAAEAVVGADLETAQAGGADVTGRESAGVLDLGGGGRDVGGGGALNGRLLGGGRLTGLELEVGTPGNGARVDTAVAAEVVVTADVVGSGARTLSSLLNGWSSAGKAGNGKKGDEDGLHFDVGYVFCLWYEERKKNLLLSSNGRMWLISESRKEIEKTLQRK